ncbi:MAG: hypothetical protein ACXWFG_07325 [Methylobacter sp.]
MKILFFAMVLTNIVLFMWEYRQGAFEQHNQAPQQHGQERILLVSELRTVFNGPVMDIDYTSLYPPGLDPLADNLLTEQLILEDFTGEFLSSAELQNEIIVPPKP